MPTSSRFRSVRLPFLVALALGPGPAVAQVTVGSDVGALSAYVWRGVSLTNRPVLQPDVYLGIPAAGGSLTLLGWGSLDLGHYNDPASDLSEGGGVSGLDLTEVDLQAEYAHTLGGKLTGALGSVLYLYPNSSTPQVGGQLTNAANRTVEVYGKLQLSDVPLSPRVQLWYDVDKVKGAYLEAGVSQGWGGVRGFPLTFGATAGFSAGQAVNGTDVANFADNGFTHLDLSASGSMAVGPFSLAPTVHLLLLHDNFVKVTEPGTSRDAKAWFGFTISWAGALGGSSAGGN